MQNKHYFIVKVFEDLSLEEFVNGSQYLATGEPLAFAKLLTSSNNVSVYLHNSEVSELMSKSIYTKATNNTIHEFSNVDSMDFSSLDENSEVVLIIWQGMRGNALDRLETSYRAYNKIQQKFKGKVKLNEYFLMTDVRCPLFKCKNVDIDTTNIELLAQATIDYRHDLQHIFETETTDAIKDVYGQETYQNFKDFKHLKLHVLPSVNVSEIYLGPKVYDMSLVFQKYKYLTGIRKEFFNTIAADRLLNDFNKVKIYTYDDAENINLITENVGNIYAEISGMIPWKDLLSELSKSTFALCINNETYDKYGLIPNRVVEALLAKSIPIFINCESAKQIPFYEKLNITYDGSSLPLVQCIDKVTHKDEILFEMCEWLSQEVRTLIETLKTL